MVAPATGRPTVNRRLRCSSSGPYDATTMPMSRNPAAIAAIAPRERTSRSARMLVSINDQSVSREMAQCAGAGPGNRFHGPKWHSVLARGQGTDFMGPKWHSVPARGQDTDFMSRNSTVCWPAGGQTLLGSEMAQCAGRRSGLHRQAVARRRHGAFQQGVVGLAHPPPQLRTQLLLDVRDLVHPGEISLLEGILREVVELDYVGPVAGIAGRVGAEDGSGLDVAGDLHREPGLEVADELLTVRP